MKNRKKRAFVGAFIALGLCGCGGGGDVNEIDAANKVNLAALDEPDVVVLGQPTSAAVENLIERRAGALPIVTHHRLIEGDRALSAEQWDGLTVVEHVVHDRRGEAIVVTGSRRSHPYTEDIRLVEHDGRVHVIRDLYSGPPESLDFKGRGMPTHLEGTDFFERTLSHPVAESGDDASIEAAASPMAATVTLSGVKGVTNPGSGISDGKVAMECGKMYNGARVANDAIGQYPWTLVGANFGESGGSVTVAGRTAKVISWSWTSIKIDPTVPSSWAPMSTTFTIQTTSGTKGTFGVSLAPAIKSRIFGQCTHYVASQRLRLGLQPSPMAYDNYTQIGANYVPKVGDQFHWDRRHTAIVLGVVTSTSGNIKTYTLTVGEQNAKCTNAMTKYTTRFQTSATSTGLVVTERPKSSISSYSAYPTLYYR
jgi:hypothetical protein